MGTNELIALLTGVIALFTYLVWRCYRRIEWLTGSLESHSMIALRLEVARTMTSSGQSVKIIWWDPDIGGAGAQPKHGDDATVNEVRIFLPPHLRQGRQGKWKKAWHWFSGT